MINIYHLLIRIFLRYFQTWYISTQHKSYYNTFTREKFIQIRSMPNSNQKLKFGVALIQSVFDDYSLHKKLKIRFWANSAQFIFIIVLWRQRLRLQLDSNCFFSIFRCKNMNRKNFLWNYPNYPVICSFFRTKVHNFFKNQIKVKLSMHIVRTDNMDLWKMRKLISYSVANSNWPFCRF